MMHCSNFLRARANCQKSLTKMTTFFKVTAIINTTTKIRCKLFIFSLCEQINRWMVKHSLLRFFWFKNISNLFSVIYFLREGCWFWVGGMCMYCLRDHMHAKICYTLRAAFKHPLICIKFMSLLVKQLVKQPQTLYKNVPDSTALNVCTYLLSLHICWPTPFLKVLYFL